MQSISMMSDLVARPRRYMRDLWQCSAVSFSAGNAFYAAATGAVGGFAIGALPAVAIQLGITAWIAHDQARATYNGEGYHTPFKRLAYANWATAAVLICGAAMTGGALSIALAALPAAVLAGWGGGHWNLSNMLDRIEKITKEGKAKGMSEEEIKRSIQNDPRTNKLLNRFQAFYGSADCSAIITAAVKGENVQAVASNLLHGVTSWESIVPLVVFGMGLSKAFSQKAGRVVDRITPTAIKNMLKTSKDDTSLKPSRYYGLGYALAGTGALIATLVGAAGDAASVLGKAVCLVGSYSAWSRGCFALDEAKVQPESADQFRARMQLRQHASSLPQPQ